MPLFLALFQAELWTQLWRRPSPLPHLRSIGSDIMSSVPMTVLEPLEEGTATYQRASESPTMRARPARAQVRVGARACICALACTNWWERKPLMVDSGRGKEGACEKGGTARRGQGASGGASYMLHARVETPT